MLLKRLVNSVKLKRLMLEVEWRFSALWREEAGTMGAGAASHGAGVADGISSVVGWWTGSAASCG